MNIKTILHQANKTLSSFSIASAQLDSEIILSKVIKKDRKYLILNANEELKKENIQLFDFLVKRRKKGEPIAYLINKKEFWAQKLLYKSKCFNTKTRYRTFSRGNIKII